MLTETNEALDLQRHDLVKVVMASRAEAPAALIACQLQLGHRRALPNNKYRALRTVVGHAQAQQEPRYRLLYRLINQGLRNASASTLQLTFAMYLMTAELGQVEFEPQVMRRF